MARIAGINIPINKVVHTALTYIHGIGDYNSKYFIITSDSTSMISEATISGMPIYVYQLPFKRKSLRFERFHNEFKKLNIIREFHSSKKLENWTYDKLDESKRIAGIIKKRIIERQSQEKRADDNEEIAIKRYKTYEMSSEPVLAYYKQSNSLKVVNGEAGISEINSEIRGLIDTIKG